jgi:dihydrofolate reductase
MGKLGSYTFVSLDGFYKGLNEDTSWNKHGQEESEFAAQNANQEPRSLIMFGRKTYEMMAGFWPTPAAQQMMPAVAEGMNKSTKIVFSKTLTSTKWENTKLMTGDLIAEVKKLKSESLPDITILGSGSLVSQLAQHNLIDHFQLMVNPIVLGSGTPLFKGIQHRLNLKLVETRPFKSGVVLLTYVPV